jgi:hypothetical protein
LAFRPTMYSSCQMSERNYSKVDFQPAEGVRV